MNRRFLWTVALYCAIGLGYPATLWYLGGVSPNPRPAPNQYRGGDEAKSHSADKQNATTLFPVEKPTILAPTQKDNDNNRREEKASAQPIGVSILYSHKDLWDYGVPLFSFLLVVVTVIQSLLLWRTFLAQYRPNARLRRVRLVADFTNMDTLRNKSTEITLLIVNQGGSPAKVTTSDLTICFDGPRHPEFINLVAIEPANTLRGVRLKPGEERVHTVHIDPNKYALSLLMGFDNTSLYLLGSLGYQDRLSRHYKTAFCRRYAFEENVPRTPSRFVRVDDPEYEYAD